MKSTHFAKKLPWKQKQKSRFISFMIKTYLGPFPQDGNFVLFMSLFAAKNSTSSPSPSTIEVDEDENPKEVAEQPAKKRGRPKVPRTKQNQIQPNQPKMWEKELKKQLT